jgi:hypothetical protein
LSEGGDERERNAVAESPSDPIDGRGDSQSLREGGREVRMLRAEADAESPLRKSEYGCKSGDVSMGSFYLSRIKGKSHYFAKQRKQRMGEREKRGAFPRATPGEISLMMTSWSARLRSYHKRLPFKGTRFLMRVHLGTPHCLTKASADGSCQLEAPTTSPAETTGLTVVRYASRSGCPDNLLAHRTLTLAHTL